MAHWGFVFTIIWLYLYSLVAMLYRVCIQRCQAMDHASVGCSLLSAQTHPASRSRELASLR